MSDQVIDTWQCAICAEPLTSHPWWDHPPTPLTTEYLHKRYLEDYIDVQELDRLIGISLGVRT